MDNYLWGYVSNHSGNPLVDYDFIYEMEESQPEILQVFQTVVMDEDGEIKQIN